MPQARERGDREAIEDARLRLARVPPAERADGILDPQRRMARAEGRVGMVNTCQNMRRPDFLERRMATTVKRHLFSPGNFADPSRLEFVASEHGALSCLQDWGSIA